MSFAMPGLEHAVQARGRVAHVVPDRFMGVEFLELDPELTQRIEQHVAAQPVLGADKKKYKKPGIQLQRFPNAVPVIPPRLGSFIPATPEPANTRPKA